MPLQSMNVQETKQQQEFFKTLHEANLRSTCPLVTHGTCNLKQVASELYLVISLRITVSDSVIHKLAILPKYELWHVSLLAMSLYPGKLFRVI